MLIVQFIIICPNFLCFSPNLLFFLRFSTLSLSSSSLSLAVLSLVFLSFGILYLSRTSTIGILCGTPIIIYALLPACQPLCHIKYTNFWIFPIIFASWYSLKSYCCCCCCCDLWPFSTSPSLNAWKCVSVCPSVCCLNVVSMAAHYFLRWASTSVQNALFCSICLAWYESEINIFVSLQMSMST